MKHRLPTLAVVVLASCVACTGLARNSPPSAVYDFGPPVAPLAATGTWSGLVLAVRTPPWFDSLNLDYRLAYDDAQVLREYAGSRWAGAPGVLIAQRLAQQLGAAGSDSAAGSSACLLRVEVHEFAQRFDTPQRSYGVLQGSASVYDARRRLLGERRFAVEQAAARADAQGGANALAAASGELGQQLADWFAGLEKDAKLAAALKACRH